MQCLACYRDKRGIITHCKLSSNGVEKVFPKDEVKAMLRQKNKIDGLRLTSDNRLIQTYRYPDFIVTGIQSYQLPNIQC